MRRILIGAACALALWQGPVTPSIAAQTAGADSATVAHVDWNAFNYGRAVDCWTRGDFRAAAGYLEKIDVTAGSPFANADRAAFLLATAYLRLHDARGFDSVAARAGSDKGSPYRRWVRYCALIETSAHAGAATTLSAPDEFAGGEMMEAALLLDAGNARAALAVLDTAKPAGSMTSVAIYLHAIARRSLGEDPASDWEALAARTPGTPAEADLVGRAAIELASARIAQPDRAARALALTPHASRFYPRALQMQALLAMEHGDTTGAGSTLRAVQHDYPRIAGACDTELALGCLMMNNANWAAALRYFAAASTQWGKESAAVSHLEHGDDTNAAWNVWENSGVSTDELRLASDALLARAGAIADGTLQTSTPPPAPASESEARTLWPDASRFAVPDSLVVLEQYAPTPDEIARVRGIEQNAVKVRADLALEDKRYAERREELERWGRYLGRGAASAHASTDTLTATIAQLRALMARLDATLVELARVRDASLAHVSARTHDMITRLQDEIVFMQAIRHFYVDGPNRARPPKFPSTVPSTAEVLAHEEALATQTEQYLQFFAAHYADVIRLSFDKAWRPRLADNSKRLLGALETETWQARGIDAAIDSARALIATDPELAAIATRQTTLAARRDSLDVAAVSARQAITVAVGARARALLVTDRETIDYHLADASYQVAIEAATDSVSAATPATAALRDGARARLRSFVSDYPASPARAESRYRLADLELLAAREEFRARMSGFLGGAPDAKQMQNRSLAPFVNYDPAIEQYQAILHEDPTFAHTDAVLFNLGMILADDGRPDAMQYLARLVADFPSSPDVQEAWLRMANDRFDARDFAAAIPLFSHAVQGNDASFTAMALYRLGWSQFEQEHFDDAVDSFAHLIDHYNGHAEIARKIDLRQEAEECLVHTLARAGGADAFTRYFDKAGKREYESRVLASLASLFRGSSLYAEAAQCETLWLARYPDDPTAFAAAERLVDTYRQWNKPDLAREAKRTQADRFLPGTAWYRAQKDDKVRTEASDFARSAYRETAAFDHAQARKSNDPGEWRDALAQYEAYLKQWPAADDSPRLHFLASDAAAHLEAYPSAMRHLSASMTSDSLSLVHDAAWQRVVVADAWYRRSQRDTQAATGTDSLAALVLKTGDEFTSRFSSDPRCADVAWRQGNVALAHRRYDDAATRLERFGTQFPADKRALTAVVRSGDARYRLDDFEAAGATYEKALAMARTAKRDSLAGALETSIPTCYYQAAERVAKADSAGGEKKAAPMFARVARSWPAFQHADLALYRAGLGFAADGKVADATGAWEELLRTHPKSEYARDSAAQIALVNEKAGKPADAAVAYERFAAMYPKDADAPDALLKSADLRAAAGDAAGAEKARTQFMAAFPGETASVMQIRATRAQNEIAAIANGAPTGAQISSLLAKGSKSELKAYLTLATAHPDLASPSILAQVDFLKAEEAHAAYAAMKLTQPLTKSIEKKKAKLEAVIALYDQCSKRAVAEYTRASAHRIGQSLIEFGDALSASERPKGLSADDLAAYNDVITEQCYTFYDRGEDAWSTLLRQSAGEKDDPGNWLAHTREVLWPRLGARFMFHPEVDYPIVRATPPATP
ncbi:MAG TPA: tetratricopeptide repeat protein [Candidatus Krumholzibacteria bacterium]|nr:tetratricopeptide repeat protein [Candidatus Krumholzibacteria bacterium]